MDPRIQYCVTQIEHKILHESTEHNTHDALIQELASEIGLTRFHLARLFQKYLQLSPRDYIHRSLMGRCAMMIAHTSQPIFSIAIDTGFSSQQAFTRAFTHYWGISPHKFRDAHCRYTAKYAKRPADGAPARPAIAPIIEQLGPVSFWAVRYEGMSFERHACWNDFGRVCNDSPPEICKGPYFGLTYDTPMFMPTTLMRYYCGMRTSGNPSQRPAGAFEITLPAGRVASVQGEFLMGEMPDIYDELLNTWLPASSYTLSATCFVEQFYVLPRHWDEQRVPMKLSCWIQRLH
ncbi:helix-turn-helix domain-containing protein [Candidimonas humi]|jgi:AraC-like DNA-binding protein/DNA gyrase inhibitor GyrI|uniref:Helix-turn-helix domain-containing protein n=1 Tax=Candidimonas humi TaxID=683355 RepID=A0ABV8NVZ0_9BURK|nr:helix-turn-helix domain-containing protein [Candidimonas humi]MBV6305177.1 helix-turn-helix domain-containing protein [Candidimonas humi]